VDAAFSQLIILGASAMLLCGFVVLGRRGVPAYVSAFAAQSMVLAGVMAVVAHYGRRPDLY
jgi:hydrogenase-4 membrane subunit HyfE